VDIECMGKWEWHNVVRKLNRQNGFWDCRRDMRVKLKWILKYLQCEFFFPHCRFRWCSVVNRGLSCFSVREELLGCVTVGVLRLTVGCGVIRNWSLQLQWSAYIQFKGKTRKQMKEWYKNQFFYISASVNCRQLLQLLTICSQTQFN